MKHARGRWIVIPLICASLAAGLLVRAATPQLTFEQRVAAQRAIEQVYYSHQKDATVPFDKAMPREVIERKVRNYLRQSAALEQQWGMPITAELLVEEAGRIARSTRMPDRLTEIYAALGNDPVLVLECLARPVLANQMARARFASDPSLQAGARHEATALRARLSGGSLSPDADDPRRTLIDSSTPEGTIAIDALRGLGTRPHRLAGQVGEIVESDDTFKIYVVLEEKSERTRLAVYSVPKQSWDEWWNETAPTFDATLVPTVARSSDVLPVVPLTQPPMSASLTRCAGNDVWDTGGNLAPQEFRYAHTAIWTGSRMIVWGGVVGTGFTNTGVQYDPMTDTVTPTTTIGAPSPRNSHSAVWTGSRMIIWGGYDGVQPVSTGASYDPMTDTWSPTSLTNAPFSRSIHAAVWTGTRMVIWGGYHFQSMGSPYLNTGALYDPQNDQWTSMTTVLAPAARNGHTAVWTGSAMIVWGGIGNSGSLSTGGRYDPQTDTWTATSTNATPTARSEHSADWLTGRMIVWGGRDSAGTRLATGGLYDPVLDTWTATTLTGAPAARSNHTAIATNDIMIVWGGSNGLNLATGGRFDPMANVWSPITTMGAPVGRASHVAVWTGSRMIIWGGDPPGGELYARYDPASDTWTNSRRVPRTNSGQAVWTGTYMIVGNGTPFTALAAPFERYDPTLDTWTAASTINAPTGGEYGVGPPVWTGQHVISMGKRYDPNADAWSPISLVDAPLSSAPVEKMVALWTGSEMILWRPGYGGRYNPATDSWTPMSTQGGPLSYDGYTGVWSGTRMIVWGGFDSFNQSAGGRQYDTATDTWSPISMVNEPSRRRGFRAVWAGGRMVVWGGYDFASGTNDYPSTGGSYDPVSDIWTSFTGLGGRENASAVSTGAEAIFWDGDGFRFDPQTGAVIPLTTLNAPSPRAGSAAIWSGNAMLVWGGFKYSPSTYPQLDGGRWTIPPLPDADGDRFDSTCDCDDSRASVHPGAPQVCDGRNNDCSNPVWPALSGTNEGDDDGDGFTECSGDCDDLVSATHPGAAEVNDGRDNQCPGEAGFGIVDEVDDLWFPDASNTSRICWLSQPGADSYRLALAGIPFVGGDAYCGAAGTSTCDDVTMSPAPGSVFFYLVHAETPLAGSWGQGSSGSETVVTCGTGAAAQEFSFVDYLLADDVPADALRNFFNSIPSPSPSDYILFEVESSPGFVESFCAQGANFYRDSYLSIGVGGGIRMSGNWKKWYHPGGGAWAGPTTDGYQNYYGSACSTPYSWCAEWGFGSNYLWMDPAATAECEVSNESAGCGAGGRLTIRIGSNRFLTCGF